jgi:hypothetical protein
VEQTLQAAYAGRQWQARPDLIVEEADGTVIALELTSARAPLLDMQKVQLMSSIDLLVLAGEGMPPAVGERQHRVVVCSLNTYEEFDVTLSPESVIATLDDMDGWIRGLTGDPATANPCWDTCSRCPYGQDCTESFVRLTRAG